MPRYPTEVRHGVTGYRGGGGLSEPRPAPTRRTVRPLPQPANVNTRLPAPANLNMPRIVRGMASLPLNYIVPLGQLVPQPDGTLAIGYQEDFVIAGSGPVTGTDPNGYAAPFDAYISWDFMEYPNTFAGTSNFVYSKVFVDEFSPHTGYVGYPAIDNGTQCEIFPDATSPPAAPLHDFWRNDYWYDGNPWAPWPSSAASSGHTGIFDVGLWEQQSNGSWNIRGRWIMTDATPPPQAQFPAPEYTPGHFPQTNPVYHPFARPVPAKRPETWPIMKPVEVVPPTYPETLPEPGQQPRVQPEPSPREAPTVIVLPPFVPGMPPLVVSPPVVNPGPGQPPVPVVPPPQVLTPQPGGVAVSQPITPPPGRRPPGRGEKERKVNLKNSVSPGVLSAVNAATESLDFVDAMYDGVKHLDPPGKRCSARDYHCKFDALYRHFEDPRFDAAAFVESWVNNQFEDYVYGRLGQATGGASRNLNLTTGLNRAINERGGASDVEDELDDIDTTKPLPVVTYDPETGRWGLEWQLFGLSIGG